MLEVDVTNEQLETATASLYAQLLADDDLSPFFTGFDVSRIEARQRQFLQFLLSDPESAPHVDLRKVHAPLLARGLNHTHFDKMLDHLDASLAETGVTASSRKTITGRMEHYRQDVLGETHTHFHVKEKSMIGRIAGMTYAILCYAIGMATLAYTAGWLGGFFVPVPLDAPNPVFSLTGLIINVGLVLMFGLQHSIMARPAFKALWTRIIPPHCERATYVLASSVAMFAMMWFWQPLGLDIWRLDGSAALLVYGVYALGWFILVSATFFLNHFDLFGLRQAWLNLRGKPYTHIPFHTPGYYRWVRHPLYVGWLTLIWATPTMTVSHLVFALATTAYILIAIPLEERDLKNMLPEYEAYRSTTPALLPGSRSAKPQAVQA